jgi:DNA ligase-1
MSKFPTLFSRTSKGQIQTWLIEVVNNGYRTLEGIQDGVITISKWTYCEGKNLGKKNETTPEEQALKDAKSKWQKKLDSGYHEDVTKIDEAKFFEPMLAHKWDEYGEEAVYPLYIQPKLDGMRCVVTKDGMFSRNGKPVVSAPHIYEALKDYFKTNPKAVFDGELYNHDLKHDFDKLMSLAKKTKPTAANLAESKEKLQFWCYDIYFGNCPTASFDIRFQSIKVIWEKYVGIDCLRITPTCLIKNKEEYNTKYSEFLEHGYEGGMSRDPLSVYENKRTKALLKRKEFIEEEFELVGLEEGAGNSAGLAASAYLKHPKGEFVIDGVTCFKAGMIGSHEYAAKLLKNKARFLGKPATIRFQNYTPDGVPRFGKLKIIRDYE